MKKLFAIVFAICLGLIVTGCNSNRFAEDTMTVTSIEVSNFPRYGKNFYIITSRTGAKHHFFSNKDFKIGDKLVLSTDSTGGACVNDLQK